MRTKYIVVDICTQFRPVRTAITFPDSLGHDEVVRALRCKVEEVYAAGFFRIYEREGYPLRVEVYGESHSLHLKPGEDDAVLIAKAIGIHESSY